MIILLSYFTRGAYIHDPSYREIKEHEMKTEHDNTSSNGIDTRTREVVMFQALLALRAALYPRNILLLHRYDLKRRKLKRIARRFNQGKQQRFIWTDDSYTLKL
jgi:hypothetical protein